jgi:hypothetical protein
MYFGGRQPLVADAGGGPLRPLPINVGGRFSVLRQVRYLAVRAAEQLQEVELTTGRRLASVALAHDAEPLAMVHGGVLVRDLRAGLAVRDLVSGRERQRLGAAWRPSLWN